MYVKRKTPNVAQVNETKWRKWDWRTLFLIHLSNLNSMHACGTATQTIHFDFVCVFILCAHTYVEMWEKHEYIVNGRQHDATAMRQPPRMGRLSQLMADFHFDLFRRRVIGRLYGRNWPLLIYTFYETIVFFWQHSQANEINETYFRRVVIVGQRGSNWVQFMIEQLICCYCRDEMTRENSHERFYSRRQQFGRFFSSRGWSRGIRTRWRWDGKSQCGRGKDLNFHTTYGRFFSTLYCERTQFEWNL